MLCKMKVEELKTFLRLRGLRVSGKKSILVARAFSAVENNTQIIKTAEEVEETLSEEYNDKLNIGDRTIPDPFKLTTGWKDEDEGIAFWPMIPTFYIIQFLTIDSEVEDLSDYKGSKAYSYFAKGWLSSVIYHPLGSSPQCLLKCDCRPSERLRDVPHKLWICISKEDGKVLKAHCTCMGNHIAAALFRVEAAIRLGLNNPACTTKACEWLPNRKAVEPVKIKNMNLNRENFGKRGRVSRRLLSTPKKSYEPLEHCNIKALTLTDIATALENVIPTSVLYTAIPKPKIDFLREIVAEVRLDEKCTSIDDIILMSNSKKEFFDNLVAISPRDIKEIEKLTRGQNTNTAWYSFRKGVITASKGHEVKAKMVKVFKGTGGSVNMWALFQKLSGYTFTNPNIPALKYGREMEVHAANKLEKILKDAHKKSTMSECGLFLHSELPYIGASPDRIFSCSCHPKACVEIKCPYSISHLSPCDPKVKLDYLKTIDGELKLNKNHPYYTQCQQQMGVTKLSKCYFIVYTAHGYLLQEIDFDVDFYEQLVSSFQQFYEDFYLKSIFNE